MSDEQLRLLAQEQAALRRVATSVARGVPPEELFAAVTEEIGQLLDADMSGMARFDNDAKVIVLATWAADGRHGGAHPLVPGPWPMQGGDLASEVWRTRGPVWIDDYREVSGPIAMFVRDELGVTSSVASPIVVEGHLWGTLFLHSTRTDEPFRPDTEARLTGFTELVATAVAGAESRSGLARLADEQAALRRVATLVARGTPPEDVFAAVTGEIGRLLDADLAGMARYENDDTVNVMATWADARAYSGRNPMLKRAWPIEGGDLASSVWRSGRSARIDDYHGLPGPIAAFVRDTLGVSSSVGSPIVVEGHLWGTLYVHSARAGHPLPDDTESRLVGFTELVATAIASAESRSGLTRLAQEQAALQRVATLVARGVPPEELFAAVVEEIVGLLPVTFASLARFESDRTGTVIATCGRLEDQFPVGSRWPLTGINVVTTVFETGQPARLDGFAQASGPLGVTAREIGFSSGVGAPVIVDGRVWGVAAGFSSSDQLLPADTEARLASFTELVATAIANAQNRAELLASRARIVAAADEMRRRIERDLHDGIQQRLVSLALELRMAQATVPSQLGELEGALAQVAQGLADVFDELRELSHGIHPAILSEGGLEPALRALCRRSVLPVEVDLHARQRLPESVEVATYYVVSEALTNATKHANASVVNVDLNVDETLLQLAIRDDGIGGADRRHGVGLVGLGDRIEALGGTLQVISPIGNGTTLLIDVPLERPRGSVSPGP